MGQWGVCISVEYLYFIFLWVLSSTSSFNVKIFNFSINFHVQFSLYQRIAQLYLPAPSYYKRLRLVSDNCQVVVCLYFWLVAVNVWFVRIVRLKYRSVCDKVYLPWVLSPWCFFCNFIKKSNSGLIFYTFVLYQQTLIIYKNISLTRMIQ